MEIKENISLKPYNTFRIDARASLFAAFRSVDDLQELTSTSRRRFAEGASNLKAQTSNLILGGGSNILFTKDFDGLVMKNEVTGIEKIKEDDNHIYIKVGAGENWHRFVLHCIKNNWAGVENLSLIPGCVGASPMQNIGAYGVEISEFFSELKAFHLKEKANYTFALKDCGFGYRDSIFKNKYKGQFAIMQVVFKLWKQPRFNTSYGVVEQELERMGVKELSIQAISQAVINIRSSKLPDPAEIGNAGSFFKNPTVSKQEFQELKSSFENIVGYDTADGSVKLAAGWLIEQCGWKGFRRGDAGCHSMQALVLVNYGNASGQEIFQLSEEIRKSVKEKFAVELEREVNLV